MIDDYAFVRTSKWPFYTEACAKEIASMIRRGHSLTGYRANASVGVGPATWSHAFKLEREIEKKFKVRHAVAVNSGTAALHAALMAMDLKGREVIVPPFTFSATVSAVLLAGGVPRFCDIDSSTFCLDAKEVKRVITKRTACILPVELFGYLPDLSELKSFGVPVVEDSCQAVGASRDGVFAGTSGIAGAYSFNGSKNLPSGEGGCLVTNSDAIAEKARRFVNHGENFGSKEVGVNYRMHELVAVVARHGLRALDVRNRQRVRLAWEFIKGTEYIADRWKNGMRKDHVFYVLPFTLQPWIDRAKFISRCVRRGLPVQESYTTPLNRLPAFKKYQTTPLPVTDELHDKTLCLLTNLTPDKPLSEARRTAKIIRESLE